MWSCVRSRPGSWAIQRRISHATVGADAALSARKCGHATLRGLVRVLRRLVRGAAKQPRQAKKKNDTKTEKPRHASQHPCHGKPCNATAKQRCFPQRGGGNAWQRTWIESNHPM